MVIYGLALMSFCMFVGMFIGNVLGELMGISADVGGVGFAMLLLILISNYLLDKDALSDKAQEGMRFWSAMYIPIVIAMAARQDVVAALSGGLLAISAGVLATVVAFLFVPALSKLAAAKSKE